MLQRFVTVVACCGFGLAGALGAGEAPESVPEVAPGLEIGTRAEPPLAPCEACASSGRRPVERLKPYAILEGEDMPGPEQRLGWSPCGACARGASQQAAFEAEMKRQVERKAAYEEYERALDLVFIDFETRFASGHFQASVQETRECAYLLDRLGHALRERLGAEFFRSAGPDSLHLIAVENEKGFLRGLEYIRDVRGHQSEDPNWFELARSAGAFGTRDTTLMRRDLLVPPRGAGLPHMTIFAWARMFVRHRTETKAPAWFAEGFASLCEHLTLGSQLCYSISYEENRVAFAGDWNKSVAQALREGKTKRWEVLFQASMIGMPALDYMSIFSVTRYLYNRDAAAFAKLPDLFRLGRTSVKALEEAYGVEIGKLEAEWGVWAKSGR